MIDTKLLMEVQDRVFADPRWQPKQDGRTFCNMATLAVCHGVGCREFDVPEGDDPLIADQMYAILKTSGNFASQTMESAIILANNGVFVLAAASSRQLGEEHGHINTLTLGDPEHSGHWLAEAPMCMNLGRDGTCFRNKGENWAFKKEPEFFAWKENL